MHRGNSGTGLAIVLQQITRVTQRASRTNRLLKAGNNKRRQTQKQEEKKTMLKRFLSISLLLAVIAAFTIPAFAEDVKAPAPEKQVAAHLQNVLRDPPVLLIICTRSANAQNAIHSDPDKVAAVDGMPCLHACFANNLITGQRRITS